jgi:DNA anti-recombination protein RmuC
MITDEQLEKLMASISLMRTDIEVIKVKLDAINHNQQSLSNIIANDHEKRIRIIEEYDLDLIEKYGDKLTDLENFKNKFIGAIILAQILGGIITAYLIRVMG